MFFFFFGIVFKWTSTRNEALAKYLKCAAHEDDTHGKGTNKKKFLMQNC